ncbi:RES domain protein [Caballeronia temeraria]|uniref:RES domain protein n=1 Tax=Caballeronia temeraria TaxID=1777137 RepID=A0A158C0P1_9BURK|nr:RES family NAD+ phosphorylase [Caballeronia temeraria]SAK75067.1 RES domain protein [Caballeronia temeraria]
MIDELREELPDPCPLPPPGFRTARIPVREIDLSVTTLLRIHWRHREPVYYNRRSTSSTVFRFDAPSDEYGVLYAASSFEACMAETLMRGRFRDVDAGMPHVIDEKAITDRCVAVLEMEIARTLRLADLTQPLWQFGFDTQVLSTPDYFAPNRWSAALHDNDAMVDGIYFQSRFANSVSVALFGDRASLVQRGTSVPLIDHPDLPAFLDRFNIGIADPSGANWQAEEAS